ncbi:MAG TPA: hypothetical protein GX706_00395 [Candidatus Moranbacteria bacterium]|nr:hypothetical protein [Candidatus Moranbacteria bacterium]
MNLKTTTLWLIFLSFFGLLIGTAFLAPSQSVLTQVVPIEFSSPVGHNTESSLGGFLEKVMDWLRGIIATVAVLFIAIAGVMYLLGGSSGNENLTKSAKNAFWVALFGLTLALAGPALLKEIKGIILINDQFPTGLQDAKTLTEVAVATLNFILTVIGILAIITLAISGIMYLAAGANITQAETAKKSMLAALIGFAMAGSALIVVQQIVNFFQ